MEVILKSINEVRPYDMNPRRNDEAVEYVANSIAEFGWQQPIVVDNEGVIIVGHTRYKAAIHLGLKEIPCVVAEHLSEEQVKAYRLADNKTAEIAVWDYELLESELAEIVDIDMEDFKFITEDIGGFIDDLLEEEYSSSMAKEGKEVFSIGFVFDIEHEDVLNRYIKVNGKDAMSKIIVAEAEKWDSSN